MTQAPLCRTSLYAEHVALGARIVSFAGWELPLQFAGIVDEHKAVRNAAGLFDVSHMGELRLRGPYAAHVVDYLVTSDARRLVDGQAMYTCACNERGMILDDLIVYRFAEEDWLIVCNGANRAKMSAHFAHAAKDHCDFEDQSDITALIALQGPRAFETLARLPPEKAQPLPSTQGVSPQAPSSPGGIASRAALSPGELAGLKSFHFVAARIAGVQAIAARTGYTGEDGVEIFCPWESAPAVWRALLEAGRPLGLKPAGLGARDTLRLEARLSLYGNDIAETTHPLEAGLSWIVALAKTDFIGKAALLAAAKAPLRRKLVGFEMVGRGVARHGYALRSLEGSEIGACTSGSPGPTVGKNIGLGYLPAEMSGIGTRFLVDCRGKGIEAVVVKTPFYKRARA